MTCTSDTRRKFTRVTVIGRNLSVVGAIAQFLPQIRTQALAAIFQQSNVDKVPGRVRSSNRITMKSDDEQTGVNNFKETVKKKYELLN